MLVLSRKQGERICIGDGIYVKLIAAQRGQALLGIEAPPHVAIDREEIRARKQARPRAAGRLKECILANEAREAVATLPT